MKIAIANDHAGFELKNLVKEHLANQQIEVIDFGCNTSDSVDYPDFAHPLAKSVKSGESNLGIVICGSGNGINMSVNKHQEIRSALCWTTEIAELSKLHNNANVLAIPARFISQQLALEIVDIFIKTDFEGGRHQRRVDKIACC
jgi:ribose 5-phosphate isomerase B